MEGNDSMKKIISFVFCLAVLFSTSCSGQKTALEVKDAEPYEQNEEETTEVSVVTCPYLRLEYSGSNVTPHKAYVTYSITDADLLSSIWEAMQSVEIISPESMQYTEDALNMKFYDEGDGSGLILLHSNDTIEYRLSGEAYKLPSGGYEKICTLLTDYYVRELSFEIDEDFLSVNVESEEPLHFFIDNALLPVLPLALGDFTQDWNLTPAEPPDGEYGRDFVRILYIYTLEGYGPVEVTAYFDSMLVLISCDNIYKAFSMDNSTVEQIAKLCDKVLELSKANS